MQRKPQIIYFSLAMPLIILVLAFINLITKGSLFSQMYLSAGSFITKGEVWRLVTFPFAFSNLSQLFLLLAVFPLLSYRIENIINSKLYGVFILLSTWGFGLGLISFFNKSALPFSGLEMVSCMILVFYTLYKPKEIIHQVLPNVKIWMYSSAVMAFWTLLNLFILKRVGLEGMILPISSLVVGGIIGILVYVQVKMKKNKQNKEMLALKTASSEHIDKFMEMAYINERKASNYANSESEQHLSLLSSSSLENEEILNIILDKINLYGKEGLNSKELKFLNELSKHLD
jgi:membrane associated rhomboid family serine protease